MHIPYIQKTNKGSWFSFSIMAVLGVQPRSSGLAAGTFVLEPSCCLLSPFKGLIFLIYVRGTHAFGWRCYKRGSDSWEMELEVHCGMPGMLGGVWDPDSEPRDWATSALNLWDDSPAPPYFYILWWEAGLSWAMWDGNFKSAKYLKILAKIPQVCSRIKKQMSLMQSYKLECPPPSVVSSYLEG